LYLDAAVGGYLTAERSSFPAENSGTLAVGILKASPTPGFRSIRVFLLEMMKVPKLTRDTRLPLLERGGDGSGKGFQCRSCRYFGDSAEAAIFAIIFSLVISLLFVWD